MKLNSDFEKNKLDDSNVLSNTRPSIMDSLTQNYTLPKKIWFIGIGGSSMSSLAEIMKNKGFLVSGSDMQESHTIEKLQEKGIVCKIGHNKENIKQETPDIVIKTDAIFETNPEIVYAKENNIPIYRRAELLGYILDGYEKSIGIAGTHGKTTTTSMITSIFIEAKKDPSALIGGKMKQLNSSYRVGKNSECCIFESCEYKESYFYFKPFISIILNIAHDHMEYFKTEENLLASFRQYCDNTKSGGILLLNYDDKLCQKMVNLRKYDRQIVMFGENGGDMVAKSIKTENGFSSFEAFYKGEKYADIELSVAGIHNVYNALAAITAAVVYGLDKESIVKGIKAFTGVGRRFEYHCTVNGAIIADDYAHHPDAYRVTFDTARSLGFKRIIAIHQPHTFSRTKMLMDDFVDVLSTVDKVLIPPIYPARETNDEYNIYAEDVVKRLPNAEYMPDFEHIADRVKELAQPGDIFITLSCGDIYKAAELITEKYGEKIF